MSDEHVCEPQPGVMHPVDSAFYDLTVKQRNHAWRMLELAEHRISQLEKENAALVARLNH